MILWGFLLYLIYRKYPQKGIEKHGLYHSVPQKMRFIDEEQLEPESNALSSWATSAYYQTLN